MKGFVGVLVKLTALLELRKELTFCVTREASKSSCCSVLKLAALAGEANAVAVKKKVKKVAETIEKERESTISYYHSKKCSALVKKLCGTKTFLITAA
jgi:hypothetical protein